MYCLRLDTSRDASRGTSKEQSFREFLDSHLEQEMLRFTTAGSVDDGKSTLIGRLLHDTKSVYEDQLASIRASRVNRSGGAVDLSLLTDGLKAEREQGITIDVAYRYFSTARRKFIIADTPGHEQYTRNMATGASTADVAIVLIDAKAFQRAGIGDRGEHQLRRSRPGHQRRHPPQRRLLLRQPGQGQRGRRCSRPPSPPAR